MLEKSGYKDIIITSAKPNISFCEKNSLEAYKINVEGTLKLIKKLKNSSLKIIFLSSDYVFDGKRVTTMIQIKRIQIQFMVSTKKLLKTKLKN